MLKRLRGRDDIEEEFKEVKEVESDKQTGETKLCLCARFNIQLSFFPDLFQHNHMRHERRLRFRCVIS